MGEIMPYKGRKTLSERYLGWCGENVKTRPFLVVLVSGTVAILTVAIAIAATFLPVLGALALVSWWMGWALNMRFAILAYAIVVAVACLAKH